MAQMTRLQQVVEGLGSGDKGQAQATRSPKGWVTNSVFGDVKKAKPFYLILRLLLLSYVVGIAISLVASVTDLYGREAERFYSDITLQTRTLMKNRPLETQREGSGSESINTHSINTLSCSSFIDGTYALKPDDVLCCDRSHFRTDVCLLRGDVRTHSMTSSILLYSSTLISKEENIRPYTRKWESGIMSTINEVTLRTVSPDEVNESDASACQVRHSVPGVVFSTGGYTGNVYHEFNDGLLPLYITSEHFEGEVVLVILEYHDWWMTKYGGVVKQLTNYRVVDFGADKRIHCFPEMIVGLRIHDELTVNPTLMKNGKTIRDFQRVLRGGLGSVVSSMDSSKTSIPRGSRSKVSGQNFKPKLVILSRRKSRVMMNQKAIVKLAERIGFQVEIIVPKRTTALAEIHRALYSCDAMLGVHGAAMTHFVFMRLGSVFIQIVPLGTDWAASTYYGGPAIKLGLKYIEYKIAPEESSLYDKYEKTDSVLTDPHSITRKGWWYTKKVYLDGQDVRPSLKRLQKSLVRAYSLLTARSHN